MLTFKRLGPQPEITRLRSRAEEIRYVTNRVETLLLAGFKSNNVSFPVNAREVAIVYPPEREVVGLLKNLEASLARVAPVSAIKGGRNQGALSNDTLKIISLLRVRGLQFPHIILVFTDSLNSDWFNNVGGSRFWLSIGMTRAEQSLTILHSADCDLIDELQESLCRFKSS
jgi:superfamily I DNA/RNA helicase